jgi:hypothetical protein
MASIQSSNIGQFLQSVGQGVKPNMFQVEFDFPGQLSGELNPYKNITNLLCKSAALPGSALGTIEVPFRGRTVKIAGDRTFDSWNPTFIVDKTMDTRAAMETWMENINGHAGNTAKLLQPNASEGYTTEILVHQLEKGAESQGSSAKKIRTYKLWYAFPTSVSTIDLAYDSNDQIEEFSVEFQYSYWTTVAGTASTLQINDDTSTTDGGTPAA